MFSSCIFQCIHRVAALYHVLQPPAMHPPDLQGENVACHCSHNDEGHRITESNCVVETWTFIFSMRIREKLNCNHPTTIVSSRCWDWVSNINGRCSWGTSKHISIYCVMSIPWYLGYTVKRVIVGTRCMLDSAAPYPTMTVSFCMHEVDLTVT